MTSVDKIPLPNVLPAVTHVISFYLSFPLISYSFTCFFVCKKKWMTNTEVEESISDTEEIFSYWVTMKKTLSTLKTFENCNGNWSSGRRRRSL